MKNNPIWSQIVKLGREVGKTPTTVGQILNMVYQEDLLDQGDYDAIVAEVKEEAQKCAGEAFDNCLDHYDRIAM